MTFNTFNTYPMCFVRSVRCVRKWECDRRQTGKSNVGEGQAPKSLWGMWVCLWLDNTSSVSDLETTTEQHTCVNTCTQVCTHTQIFMVFYMKFTPGPHSLAVLSVAPLGGQIGPVGGMLLKHPHMHGRTHWTHTHTHTHTHTVVLFLCPLSTAVLF